MRLALFIFFLFALDIYFYLGTISNINKLTDDYSFIYKGVYWSLSIFIYIFLISFLFIFKDQPKPIIDNGIFYSTVFIILFFSKLLGSIPLFIDDIIRLFRLLIGFFADSDTTYNVKRLDFLKKSALLVSATLFSTLLLGVKWGRYNFKRNLQEIYIKIFIYLICI